MKILVLGSNGMAGHIITKYMLLQGHEVTTFARSNADIIKDVENQEEIVSFFNAHKGTYDFIINCIGLLVKDSIDRPDRAAIINGWFPHVIETIIKNSHTKLIHLSTDCVFDGQQGNYIEADTHTETNFYGRSKSYGEINNDKDITFRMSIIGTEIKTNGTGLLNWVLNNKETELSGWENALWNGMTTLQLAKSIHTYIKNPTITGVYHLVNNEVSINKYELLCKINETFNLNKIIKKVQGPKSVNKILVDTRKEFDVEIPNYDIQLKELKEFV